MSTNPRTDLIAPLLRAVLQHEVAHWPDGQLLERYLADRDDLLFEILVERHGPMVFGLCRRMLGDTPDAEDAFQATFLVLVRKAASVRPSALVGNWLYGVAYHTARRVRSAAFRRHVKEKEAAAMRTAPTRPEPTVELAELLDQELSQLPDKYRAPIVLCDLEGKTRKEAARHLGCPEGTVAGRLARARVLLAQRLSKRGIALSGGVLAIALAGGVARAGVPTVLAANTVKAAALAAAGKAATGLISTQATLLAEGVVKTMLVQKLKLPTALLVLTLMTCGGALAYRALAAAPPELKSLAEAPPPVDAKDKSVPLAGDDVKENAGDVLYLEDNVLRSVSRGKVRFETKLKGQVEAYGAGGGKVVVLSRLPDALQVFDATTGKRLARPPVPEGFVTAFKVPPQPFVVVDAKGTTAWFCTQPRDGGKTVLWQFDWQFDVGLWEQKFIELSKVMSDTASQPIPLGAEVGVADSHYVEKLDRKTRKFVRVCADVQEEAENNNRGRFEFVEGLGVFKFKWQQNKVVQFTDKDLMPLAKPVEFKLACQPASGRMEFTGRHGDLFCAVAAVSTEKFTRIEAIDLTTGNSLWKKELDFPVTKIAPGANGTVLLVAPVRLAILKYDPWAWTDSPVVVARINADDHHWIDGIGLISDTTVPGKEVNGIFKPLPEADKGKELRAAVTARQNGRAATFGTGLNTQVEGLALAVLGSCGVEGEANRKGWLAALEGDHLLVTFSKPRLLGVSCAEDEFPALEVLVPMSSSHLPDHVWVRYEDKYRKFAKYTPQAALLLQEVLKDVNRGNPGN